LPIFDCPFAKVGELRSKHWFRSTTVLVSKLANGASGIGNHRNWNSKIKNQNSKIGNTTSRGLNGFAILVACATFFLIIAGALVTSNDAGLATPDWPLSNGQVFPKMVGNLFWEHGHRLVATSVGMLTIVLTVYLFLKEKRIWVRRLGLFALFAVIAQGLLGGLTVKLMLPLAVSSAHATLAQLFFCMTVSLAVFTSRSWTKETIRLEEKGALPVRYLCPAALVTIFLQLILGATLRHSATWDRHLPTELVLAHIGGALAVLITLGSAAGTILRRYKGETFLTRPATIGLGLLVLQLGLGIAAYLTRLASPNDPQPLNPMISITVAHVACGALVFVTTIVLTLRTYRVVRAKTSVICAVGKGGLPPLNVRLTRG
jgi:heme a synthase